MPDGGRIMFMIGDTVKKDGEILGKIIKIDERYVKVDVDWFSMDDIELVPMTMEDLVNALKGIDQSVNSEEGWHIEADRLLLQFIHDDRVMVIFDAIPKWYSLC
jgi:hypothetical protein